VALVVLLRGVNVGGHRTFRPSRLAEQLKHLDAVSIGAAGTFVIRKPISRARLRHEFARRLPFDAEIVICHGREVAGLMARDGTPVRHRTVPAAHEDHQLSRQAGSGLRGTGHYAQLEYHCRDRFGAEYQGDQMVIEDGLTQLTGKTGCPTTGAVDGGAVVANAGRALHLRMDGVRPHSHLIMAAAAQPHRGPDDTDFDTAP